LEIGLFSIGIFRMHYNITDMVQGPDHRHDIPARLYAITQQESEPEYRPQCKVYTWTNNTVTTRECYYQSVRTENKGFLALFSVRQRRWVDLSLGRLGFSVTCTVHSGNPRTVDRNSWKWLQTALDV